MNEPSRAELKYLVERQREELRTINDVGRLLSSTTEPLVMLRLLGSYLRQAFPLAACGFALFDQKRLHAFQFAKISPVDLDGWLRELQAAPNDSGTATPAGAPLETVLDQGQALTGQWAQAPMSYIRSRYLAALVFGDQKIGVLGVASGQADAFSNEDRHVIDTVAAQLSAALRNALLLDALKRTDSLKQDLLMVISHELRIPLTSIREGVTLVLDNTLGPVTEDQREFLGTVQENAGRLHGLVEKVVMATQIVTGQARYTKENLSAGDLLSGLRARFEPQAAAKGVRLEVSEPIPAAMLSADPKLLSQALGNIVENAIQASTSGKTVRMECKVSGQEAVFGIADKGPGIAAEELPRLFDQFRSIGGVDDRKTGGLGLGLFTAKSIVTGHGGSIEVESRLGEGTRVSVRLPIAAFPGKS